MTPERLARLMATVTSEYAPQAYRQQALAKILWSAMHQREEFAEAIDDLKLVEEVTT